MFGNTIRETGELAGRAVPTYRKRVATTLAGLMLVTGCSASGESSTSITDASEKTLVAAGTPTTVGSAATTSELTTTTTTEPTTTTTEKLRIRSYDLFRIIDLNGPTVEILCLAEQAVVVFSDTESVKESEIVSGTASQSGIGVGIGMGLGLGTSVLNEEASRVLCEGPELSDEAAGEFIVNGVDSPITSTTLTIPDINPTLTTNITQG